MKPGTLNHLKISLFALVVLGLIGIVIAKCLLWDSNAWRLQMAFAFSLSAFAGVGFALAAAVYVLNLGRLRPLLRPALLTGWLGYALLLPLALHYAVGHRT